jgi:hypothetical protein
MLPLHQVTTARQKLYLTTCLLLSLTLLPLPLRDSWTTPGPNMPRCNDPFDCEPKGLYQFLEENMTELMRWGGLKAYSTSQSMVVKRMKGRNHSWKIMVHLPLSRLWNLV